MRVRSAFQVVSSPSKGRVSPRGDGHAPPPAALACHSSKIRAKLSSVGFRPSFWPHQGRLKPQITPTDHSLFNRTLVNLAIHFEY